MPVSRRALLAGSGLVATGVGVWQRRRIVRYPELEAMREATDYPVPSFEAGAPVADAHLEAAYDRALTTLEDAHEATPDGQGLSPTRSDLERFAPDELAGASRAERRNGLTRLREYTRGPHRAIGAVRYEEGDLEESTLDERIDEVRAALEAAETPYRGESLADAVVVSGIVDDRRLEAELLVDEADDRAHRSDGDYARSWRDLAVAEAHLEDGDWHEREIGGDDFGDRLATVLERAASLLEGRTREDEVGRIRGFPTYARDVVRYQMHRGTSVSSVPIKIERGFLASGVRAACYRYTTFEILEAFDDVPSSPFWERFDWTVDADGLPDRKRAAVDAVESTLENHDDPLVRWLLAAPVDILEDADRGLGRQVENVTDADADRWQSAINGYHARCLTTEAFAEQVPDTVATLLE
ncbi:hypothetical protein [Natrononativus amylolyticus]|uniref:hypothetical protein n=1 Tax=Natrononativus amylolyticus TaxID=2963434 RepID=UPI0020CE0867|nr:hypothetical protein [Natrononativus amylolyticus]